jgi:uncharacterized membrane protein
MQWINVVVINPWFLTAFFGTAIACVLAMIVSLVRWHLPEGAFLLAGSVFYLAGAIVVTMIFNVSRNNALAAIAPASPEAAMVWVAYVSIWTEWNHVRTLSALAACVSFSIALWLRK